MTTDTNINGLNILSPSSMRLANTLNLACTAQCCYQPNSIEQALELLRHWPEVERPLVLGGGSNVLLPERLTRPVLLLQAKQVHFEPLGNGRWRVLADAGLAWDDLVAMCVQHGLHGIENLSWIPGTVGAAPVQNIGAYGVELKDCFAYAQVYDFEQGSLRKVEASACDFTYRDSIFKRAPGRYVILQVALELSEQADFSLGYGELKELQTQADEGALSLAQVREQVIAVRQAKLPDPSDIPNAGSFFKNPVVSQQHYQTLLLDYPDLHAYALPNGDYKLAAGWMIDRAGWKGFRAERAGVHAKQALVLTNLGGANQSDILSLAEQIQQDIAQKFALALEIEPVRVV